MAIKDYFGKWLGGASKRTTSAYKEAGKSSTAIQGGTVVTKERNRRLIGENKFRTYEDMISNVTIIFASVRLYTTLVASSAWSAQPKDDSSESKQMAETVMDILNDMEQPFVDAVKAASLYKFNGFSWLEMTAKKRDDGTIGLKSIEQRPCRTVQKWDVDDNGNIIAVGQTLPLTNATAYIPRWKSIYLVENLLTDSPEGFGMLRAVAETASRLQEIQKSEKMGINRDMRGIPVGRVPYAALAESGMSKEEIEQASSPVEEFVRMVQVGETTGLVLDSANYVSGSSTQTGESQSVTGNRQYDLELLSAGTTGLSDVDTIIRRLNMEIARSLGSEVLLLGDGGSGSLALSKDKSSNLLIAVNSLLKEIADQFNKDILPFLAKLNGWDLDTMPILTPSEVSQRSIEEIVSSLRDLASAGITLDRRDESVKEVFRALDLTPLDESIKEEDLF